METDLETNINKDEMEALFGKSFLYNGWIAFRGY